MRSGPVATVGLALIVSACSIGRPMPAVATYRIEPTLPTADVSQRPRPERLRVERTRVAAPYERSALVYRMSAVRYVSDPYHAFLADPGPMLSDQIAEWLAAKKQFAAIEGPEGAAPAPWILETTVTELYGDFQQGSDPAAVISLRFSMIDQSSPRAKVTYQRTIARRISLSSASPEALVRGYGTALAEILSELSVDLAGLSAR